MARGEYKYKLSKKYLSKLRKDWVNEKWAKHKNEVSMADLGEIFGVDPSFIWRAIGGPAQRKQTLLRLKKK